MPRTDPGHLPRLSALRAGMTLDRICLRDPRGRSLRPSLEPVPRTRDFRIHGPFTILQEFRISPEEGRAFVDSSGDPNPIHTEDTVIPGAMTGARFLLLPEILVPGLAVRSLRVKFRAFSHYGRPTVNLFQVRPRTPDGDDLSVRELSILVKCFQQGTLVADAAMNARLLDAAPDPGMDACGHRHAMVPECPSAELIRAFLRSLRVRPEQCLAHLGWGYPRAFLAALPPGEMVRNGGAGGLLNVLHLEFPEIALPSIHDGALPVAEVEASRPRSRFRKVLARVGSGIRTYCQGYATVLASMVRGNPASPEASAS